MAVKFPELSVCPLAERALPDVIAIWFMALRPSWVACKRMAASEYTRSAKIWMAMTTLTKINR